MDPVFTIPYPEFAIASQLSEHFSSSRGYAIFIPASRQQKGVDLLLTHRTHRTTRCISIQVKSSRTYSRRTQTARSGKIFRYYTWYNNFDAPPEADFIFLIALFPNDERNGDRGILTWWSQLVLVFTHDEMVNFLNSVMTVGGKKDKMFGFGFDSPDRIEQTRGDQLRRFQDFTPYLLRNRIAKLEEFVTGAPIVGAANS